MVESLVVALATNYKSAKMGASASRRAKRKRVTQQDGNSAPLKKTKKNRKYLPYEEAKKVVNALGLKSKDDWKLEWICRLVRKEKTLKIFAL